MDIALPAMKRFLDFAGARNHGSFTLDFKENTDGVRFVTEVSIRNAAFNGCFAELGANFSEDIVRQLTGDSNFDRAYRQYDFDDDYVFIRDVDVEPIILRESNLLGGDK